MTSKNNDVYRNQPQFKTNQSLNKDITPDVPTFNSNAMDNEGFMPLKEDMLKYMERKAEENSFSMVMLLLTDILNEGSQILVAGKAPEIVEKTFSVTLEASTAFLPGVLSRKKQVIPPLTNVISTM